MANFVVVQKYTVMDAAELKLDLFRRLDRLDNKMLEVLYDKIICLINTDSTSSKELSPEIKAALDEALEASKQGRVYSHEDVVKKTKDRYPNLF